ncbi:thiamine biosynthesis protein ApbE [Chryseobacterium sp. Leaf180]|uniref:FAD:protein FMN transferase n=1 Tax=Chryseobacterium sp. Leaf180 TaxID=1736289 RepID=UPI0006F41F9B|nr:FAD:protein FMN transferase [Chryseobacterium sp. Leaf180]KQR94462.1 thiamine biosynthesis protein ApbE [Chryseobacterium sp. Leaf180]
MLHEFRKNGKLMGNAFQITVVGQNEELAEQNLEEAFNEIRRIESLLTTFNEESDTQNINRNAGIQPVKVAEEVYGLIERSLMISRVTNGFFDITYGGIDRSFWNFDRTMTKLPDIEKMREGLKLVDYRKIILNPKDHSVFLLDKGMRIGFGGIGKGYAAEMAKRLLESRGVTSGIVNAAGDLSIWGTQADGKPWTVGIADPNSAGLPFSYLNISNMAVATSGNYEKFVEIGGKKYSHTIHPKTGMPAHGVKSATVFCPNAEIADAMATPISIMDRREALGLINQIKDLECIIIDDDDQLFVSDNIRLR